MLIRKLFFMMDGFIR